MNTRERWMTAGLIMLGLALVVGWFWEQVRFEDAQRAVREYVGLEQRLEKAESGRESLARQARPEIRRSLLRGEFDAALKRAAALQQEDGGDNPAPKGKGLSVDELWPPNSPARETTRKLLRALVEKQQQGYDLEAAREALVKVADAARSGKKDQAAQHLGEVRQLVQQARLRPGFKAPQTSAAASGLPADLPAQLTPEQERTVFQLLRTVQMLPPQMLESYSPAQRELFVRLQGLSTKLLAVYRSGKDWRPAVRILFALAGMKDKVGKPGEDNDLRPVHKVLDLAESALRSAPPLPAGTPPPGALRPGLPGGKPGAPASAPELPAITGTMRPSQSAGDPGERLLSMLDGLRKMPDEQYRQMRPQLAALLTMRMGALAGHALGRPAEPPGGVSVGDAAGVQLQLGPAGEIRSVRAASKDLTDLLPAAGYTLSTGDGPELPLKAPVKPDAKGATQRVSGAEGVFEAEYRKDGEALVLRARTRRSHEGKPLGLVLRLPLRLAGWRWHAAGADGELVAADDSYAAPAGELAIEGRGLRLTIAAPDASGMSYDPEKGLLTVQFDLGTKAGPAENTVRLSARALEK